MLLLELLPENSEIFEKILKNLHNRGWTFGKGESISRFMPYKNDDRIYIYDDKTIRIGDLISARFCKAKLTIQVNEESLASPPWYDEKWVEEAVKEFEKSILKGVYKYGKASF